MNLDRQIEALIKRGLSDDSIVRKLLEWGETESGVVYDDYVDKKSSRYSVQFTPDPDHSLTAMIMLSDESDPEAYPEGRHIATYRGVDWSVNDFYVFIERYSDGRGKVKKSHLYKMPVYTGWVTRNPRKELEKVAKDFESKSPRDSQFD